MEEESMKLYGINLKQAIEEFRRTPEYLNILMSKYDEWSTSNRLMRDLAYYKALMDLKAQVTGRYEEKKDKVRASLRLREMLKKKRPDLRTFPYDDDDWRGNGPQLHRHENFINLTGVKLLEMKDHRSILTAKDKMDSINQAYQFVGNVVHTFIRSASPDGDADEDTSRPATMLDGGDDKESNSTTPHNHLVPSVDSASNEQNASTTEAGVFSTRHDRHMKRPFAH